MTPTEIITASNKDVAALALAVCARTEATKEPWATDEQNKMTACCVWSAVFAGLYGQDSALICFFGRTAGVEDAVSRRTHRVSDDYFKHYGTVYVEDFLDDKFTREEILERIASLP